MHAVESPLTRFLRSRGFRSSFLIFVYTRQTMKLRRRLGDRNDSKKNSCRSSVESRSFGQLNPFSGSRSYRVNTRLRRCGGFQFIVAPPVPGLARAPSGRLGSARVWWSFRVSYDAPATAMAENERESPNTPEDGSRRQVREPSHVQRAWRARFTRKDSGLLNDDKYVSGLSPHRSLGNLPRLRPLFDS